MIEKAIDPAPVRTPVEEPEPQAQVKEGYWVDIHNKMHKMVTEKKTKTNFAVIAAGASGGGGGGGLQMINRLLEIDKKNRV